MRKSRSGAVAPKFVPKVPLKPDALARVQGAVATQHGGKTPKGSYVGDLQRVIAKRPT
jgi:hypothetical protein